MSEEKKYKAVESKAHSNRYDKRFVIVSTETGEILDDAQGYGYKTAQKAYAAYSYKTRDPQKVSAALQKQLLVHEFCQSHKSFVRDLEAYAFEIAKGSWRPEDKFDAALVRQMFKKYNYDLKELGFTAGEFLRYWNKPLPKEYRKKKKR